MPESGGHVAEETAGNGRSFARIGGWLVAAGAWSWILHSMLLWFAATLLVQVSMSSPSSAQVQPGFLILGAAAGAAAGAYRVERIRSVDGLRRAIASRGCIMRITILDDYQEIFGGLSSIGRLRQKADVRIYREKFASEEALIRALKGSQAVIPIRERTQFPANLLQSLPDLEIIAQTGFRLPYAS